MNQELTQTLHAAEKSPHAIAQAVAIVIRTAQQAIEATGLTADDMDRFFEEHARSDALMPLVDPTAWMRGGKEELDAIRHRGNLVRSLVTLPVRGEGGLVGAFFTAAFSGEGEVKGYFVAPLPEESEQS